MSTHYEQVVTNLQMTNFEECDGGVLSVAEWGNIIAKCHQIVKMSKLANAMNSDRKVDVIWHMPKCFDVINVRTILII